MGVLLVELCLVCVCFGFQSFLSPPVFLIFFLVWLCLSLLSFPAFPIYPLSISYRFLPFQSFYSSLFFLVAFCCIFSCFFPVSWLCVFFPSVSSFLLYEEFFSHLCMVSLLSSVLQLNPPEVLLDVCGAFRKRESCIYRNMEICPVKYTPSGLYAGNFPSRSKNQGIFPTFVKKLFKIKVK